MMTGLPAGSSHRCVCDTSQTGDVTGLAQRLAELDSFAVRHLDNGGSRWVCGFAKCGHIRSNRGVARWWWVGDDDRAVV